MNSNDVLKGLERERQLLENFICLSEEQLLVLDAEDVAGFESFLEKRSELMLELNAIEKKLANWIVQIAGDASVPVEMLQSLRTISDEIARMTNHVLEIDSHAHKRLQVIARRKAHH